MGVGYCMSNGVDGSPTIRRTLEHFIGQFTKTVATHGTSRADGPARSIRWHTLTQVARNGICACACLCPATVLLRWRDD